MSQATSPGHTHLYRAEPYGGFIVELFDKARPSADVRLSRPGSGVELGFELVGAASSRLVDGAVATAQVGDVKVTWTSYADRLKEDLVLSGPPANDEILFNVHLRGLAFVTDNHGGI